jgi:2-keto-4-pentenoate hydratase/2-oxohepta-3-ene-1,7-dioic acid hydratase in catechol pathway
MRVATFEHLGKQQVGVLHDGSKTIHPLEVADMIDLIARLDGCNVPLAEGMKVSLADVRLVAPIPKPRRNIICVGKNYREHAKEFSNSGYEANAVKEGEIDLYPAVFTKLPSSVVGTGAVVETHPSVTSAVDYEGELAVVIGRSGRNISRANAPSYVWGYTIINDVTARDRQRDHRQWFLGKSLDTFCPMGPWITTANELDAANLQIRTWVNGELRQDANTRDLIFGIPQLIETISAGLTLQAGDIIATGTPAGVGLSFDPPKFLKAGDVVSISSLKRRPRGVGQRASKLPLSIRRALLAAKS